MKRIYSLIIVLSMIFPFSPFAFASNSSWINTGITGASWLNSDNWSLGFIPGATSGTTNTDIATFNTAVDNFGISSTPIIIDSGRNLGGINFDTAAGNYFIGSTAGNPLLLTSGGAIQILGTLSATNAIETINAPLVIEGSSGTYAFENNSANGTGADAGTLNFGGGITGGASGNTVLTLSGSNTNLNTISGTISNGSATSLGITKSGVGTWVLSGPNTYTGTTTISSGTLIAGNTQALGNSTAPLSLGGGILDLATDSSITAYNTTVTGNSTILSDRATSGAGITQTLGTLSIGADTLSVTAGSNVSSGTAGLTFGAVTLSATGAAFTANSETLLTLGAISGSGDSFTVSGAGNTDITGIIGTGAGTLTKSGTGTLILTGANTYSGLTTISGGTLQIGNNGTTGSLGSGSVTDNGNLAFDLTSSPTVSDAISGTGAVTQNGTGTVTLSGANTYTGATAVNAGTLEAGIVNQAFGVGSAVAVGSSATLDLGGNNETIGSLAGAGIVTNSGVTSPAVLTAGGNSGSTTFSGIIEDGTSTIGLTKVGSGTLTLSGSNDYSGNTTVSAGVLNIQNNDALGTGAGSASVTSGATLQIQGGITTPAEALTLNGTGVSSNGALENVSGNNTYAGLVTLGSAAQINSDSGTLTLSNTGTITGSGDALTVGGAGNTAINSIIGTGAGTLTKEGAGTLTLTGANTYSGGTTLDTGTLNLGSSGAIGSSGTIIFDGGTLQYSASNTTDYSGRFSATANQEYNIDTNGQSVIFNTALDSSGGSLTKDGTGTLSLTAANTYNGGTTVNDGTLTVSGSGTLGATTGALSVNNTNTGVGNAATLNLSTGGATTVGSLSGTIATPSSGTNTATINNGGSGHAFTVNQTVNGTYAGVIAGAGGFDLGSLSTGTLTLSGDNTYSGGTTISAGTLQVGNTNALGTGAVINNAALSLGTASLSLGSGSAYTQGTDSTLDLTANSTSSYGKIVSTVASSVAAVSTLNVTVGGYFQNGVSLDIINTGGAGITLTGGATPPAVNTLGSSIISFTDAVSGGNLVLIAENSGLAPLANNANARAVGTALQNITNPSSDMNTVLGQFAVLSDSKISSALNTMGPVVDGGVVQNSAAALDNLVSATLDRVQSNLDHAASGNSASSGVSSGDESSVNGIWAKPYGSYLTQGTLQGIQGYDAWNAGTVVGYDRMITDDFTFGVSGGYGYGQVESDVNNANTNINSAQGTIYAGYQDPNLNYFIDGTGSFGWNWYDGQRDITVGTINRTADADYNGQQYGVYLEGGYKFNFENNLKLTPLASIQWTHLSLDSYTETGANSLDLNVGSQSYDILESGLGASISYPQQFNWGNFTPEVHAKWLYDFINDNMSVTSSFTGGGGSFTSNGANPSKEGADIGGKLSFDFPNNFSLIAAADAELKDGFFGVYGSGTVRYKF